MEPIHFLKRPRGFTLIEMLVVLAIIVIITGIALVGQTSFNRSLILTDTAYNIGLSIREAQSYGLSTRIFSGIQNAGYGVRFSRITPSEYITFSDILPAAPGTYSVRCPGHDDRSATSPEARPGNCYYSDPSELLRTYTFSRGFYISNFCGITSGGTNICSSSTLSNMDIVFLRPNTETIITGNNATQSFVRATITVMAPDNQASRCINVTALGAISVSLTCP
ncbi:prepilin-type N-terminal cleavage/methylation domain-containing protein [Patescibacteria group bacterium]|nr:prepilin-type N-terminal cleavage/methylation domain-containing protein [Patescibacteria group bacterium]MBU0801451.1 prepilin-type N-terminal cleavage/methylation domain-containing protein [Alphaproteobacteria bacterium]MBU1754898.1 prepilin-type N-terminal cleavage/methylation domain-containing protein [Patescibacteria group bacterium]